MKGKDLGVLVIILLLMFGLTACANSSDGSSSETKTVVPVKQTSGDTPVYNKRFSVPVNGNTDNITQSENNKLVNKANAWVAKQNLKEYTPHFMQYVADGAGDPDYLNENVTMVKKE